MNENSIPTNEQRKKPLPITAEEFDAKFDAGEDISDYLDWDSMVVLEPGEISPGQKLSMAAENAGEIRSEIEPLSVSSENENLQISISKSASLKIGSEAVRQGVSREELIQSWIKEKVGEKAIP